MTGEDIPDTALASVSAFNSAFLHDFIIMRTAAVNTPLLTFFPTVLQGDWSISMTRLLEYILQLPRWFLPLNPGC